MHSGCYSAHAVRYGNRDGRAAKHTLKLLTNSSGIQSRVLLMCQDLEYLYQEPLCLFKFIPIMAQIFTRNSKNRILIRDESNQRTAADHGFP